MFPCSWVMFVSPSSFRVMDFYIYYVESFWTDIIHNDSLKCIIILFQYIEQSHIMNIIPAMNKIDHFAFTYSNNYNNGLSFKQIVNWPDLSWLIWNMKIFQQYFEYFHLSLLDSLYLNYCWGFHLIKCQMFLRPKFKLNVIKCFHEPVTVNSYNI